MQHPSTAAGERRALLSAPRQLLIVLLLAAILESCGRVESIGVTEDVYADLKRFRPHQPAGGPYTGTNESPPREIRATFEGIDYDNPSHQVSAVAAIKSHYSCTSEYSRCILRQPKAAALCLYNFYTGYYYKIHSICDIEYNNCVAIAKDYASDEDNDELDFRMNRYTYESEGWHLTGDYKYCKGIDEQFAWGWRRAAAAAAYALGAARRAAITGVRKLF